MLKHGAPAALAVILSFAGQASPAHAATAHNSQAGSWGPNSHTCAATPYFPADRSCFPADLFEEPIGPDDARGARYHGQRRPALRDDDD